MNILAVLFLSLLVSTAVADQSNVFDVTSSNYGGKPDSDISKALITAWKDACASPSTSTVLVPRGTYDLLQQTTFEGPCNAPIQFQLQGTLQAPKDRSQLDDSWVIFKTIDRLTLSGGGTFDGQGELSWKKEHHDSIPVDIRFRTINNSIISDITFMDSAKFHSSVHESNNVTFQRVTITAPEDSPNTDGIHIASSTIITVSDSHIATGDDCVSIGDGSNQILVSNITCGPGHGISIGSLGKYPDEQPVVGVTVKNCTLTGTTNGARIKTWPDSPSSSVAKDILYQDLIMVDVKNPILIDQNYCDDKGWKQNVPSRVQISDVRFKNIRGSSSSPVAVKLDCSHNKPCLNVELSDIDLMYSGDKKDKLTSECNNVKPRITDVNEALACANLGDIPVHNSPTPSTSPPLVPAPVQQSPPPPPVEKHHSPESPPLSPPPLVSPPPPSVVTTLPSPPVVTTPPLPPVVTTPPLPPVVTTPPLPPVVTTPPALPPSPRVASDDSTPTIVMVYGDPYYSRPRPYGPGFGPTSSAAGNVPKHKPRAIVIGIIIAVIAGAGLISMWYSHYRGRQKS